MSNLMKEINTIELPRKVILENGLEYVIEDVFINKGYVCVVVLQNMGHRCGYIHISNTHPLCGKKDNELNYLVVHGGVTYSKKSTIYPIPSNNQHWIGFDCRHADDASDYGSAFKYWDNKLLKRMYELDNSFNTNGVIRTEKFVKKELIKLTEQLSDI